MSITPNDLSVLRSLAGRYAELANLDIQQQRLDRYRSTNALETPRPVVLIHELPWGEIADDALKNVCAPELAIIETPLRRALYQAEHFPVDQVFRPVWKVGRVIRDSGVGLEVQEGVIQGDTGTHIQSHAYTDMLKDEADLDKLRLPEISYDAATTEARLAAAREVFDGLLPVELAGVNPTACIWDDISRYRGVEGILMDLIMKPDFMHATARKFTDITAARFRQYEQLGLLDADPLLVHCTVGATDALPPVEADGKVRMKNVWGRCAAQIFGEVSPQMHDEFDLAYNQELFGECGLLYYGCCEPMDRKIDILRTRFANLRKISITPWADAANAAKNIGADFVLAAKPNPAFVAMPNFNPEPVAEEIARYCRACQEHNTPLEFVLKDVSTIANNPQTIIQWAKTVKETIDQFYE